MSLVHFCFKTKFQSILGEVVLTIAYLINRMSSKVLRNQSSIIVLSEFYHNLYMSYKLPPKVFGCIVFVNIYSHRRDKLDPRALKCVFVGYSNTKMGYINVIILPLGNSICP